MTFTLPKQTITMPDGKTPPLLKPSKETRIRAQAVKRAGIEKVKRDAAKEAGVPVTKPGATPRRKFTKLEIADTYEKCNHACVDCGKGVGDTHEDGQPVKLQIDHQVPLASGGTYDRDNLVLRCDRHNQAKSASRAKHWRHKKNDSIVDALKEVVGKKGRKV